MNGSGKHSSLLRYGNNYCRKKFFSLGPRRKQHLIDVVGIAQSREALLKGKAQYGWPPSTYLFRRAAFCIENIIPLSVRVPWLNRS